MSTLVDPAVPHSLRLRRCPVGASSTPATNLLGGLCYGQPARATDGAARAGLDAPLLSTPAWQDVLEIDGEVVTGQDGRVSWRRSGPWLFGALQLDEATEPGTLTELSRVAYSEVFSMLQRQGEWHLLRVWNYLPRINAVEGGLERYRQFNVGRQQAFADHQRDNLGGSPAACAIGTPQGPLCIYFLAGRTPSEPLENPRQVPAYHYPTEFGPRSPTFSRACLVTPAPGQCLLLISGTASIVGHATLHTGDVRAQTEETLRNLQAVIEAAQSRCTARFPIERLSCTVYLRHAQDVPTVRTVLEAAWGAHATALREWVLLEADVCRSDLLIEIEAHACSPGEML